MDIHLKGNYVWGTEGNTFGEIYSNKEKTLILRVDGERFGWDVFVVSVATDSFVVDSTARYFEVYMTFVNEWAPRSAFLKNTIEHDWRGHNIKNYADKVLISGNKFLCLVFINNIV